MNLTLVSLEALILKATHESLPCPDAAALEAFCTIMRDSADGPQLAAQALAARIHTRNPREALLALSMLDRCMQQYDTAFHNEIGKFRFLNEMIKLVSPKYFADRTSPEVQNMVVQLLHSWITEYPRESKFKVAYDMLKNQGVVKETPPPLPPEDPPRNRDKNAIFEDEEKAKLLQKLLQSKKPEDVQHANRLIKTMVKEEERRNEESSRRAQEVGNALDSAELLRELLANAADASPEEEQLIHELHVSCVALRLALQRLAASETQPERLNDILHASGVLDEVFEKYDAYSKFTKEKKKSNAKVKGSDQAQASNSDSLLDFAGNLGKGDGSIVRSSSSKNTAIDELGDIFSTGSESKNIAEPLKPVNLMPSDDVDLLGDKTNKAEGWNELDSLGEQLIKQSLPDHIKRLESFNGKTAKKIPMNALASPKHELPPSTNGALFDLDFFTKKPEEQPKPALEPQRQQTSTMNSPPDDVIVDISTDAPSTSNVSQNAKASDSPIDNILDLNISLGDAKCKKTSPTESVESNNNSAEEKRDQTKIEVKPLTDIDVSLSNVTPSSVPPMTIFEEDNGLTVVLHFCKDIPRPDVNVIVISTTNKHKKPILDFRFQGVVPKCCKVRLLTPSGTSLPQYNPFLPPPAITQVMLIARPPSPARPPISLRFVISYTCDDDTCSEIGDVSDLPLDDV